MSEPDFEEQLRLEELERSEKTGDAGQVRRDEDGTEYVWDAQKKAWFPKIDENFIAQYQMNYGSEDTADKKDESAEAKSSREADYYNWYHYHARRQPGANKDDQSDQSQQSYDEYYKQYYEHYYNTQASQSDDSTQKDGAEAGDSEKKEYTEQEWLDYYRYYGYDVSEYYADQVETEDVDAKKEEAEPEEGKGKKRKKKEKEKTQSTQSQGWFEVEEEKNTNVYVRGLPNDVTDDEFKELMNKCGLILYDPKSNKPKIKLYRDELGQPKGDGLCCYIKIESVDLALQILDGSDVRGHTIHVERAQFEMKGKFDPSKRRKLTNKEKRKFRLKQAKLLDWRPEKEEVGGRGKHERVVVLKHMFNPASFDHEPTLINEIRSDIRSEGSKFGDVRKVVIYDRHPEGIATVTFKEPEEADECIKAFNGRWFAKQQISAETWDGRTKYDIQESEAEREARIKKWEDYLEDKIKPESTKGEDHAKKSEGREDGEDVQKVDQLPGDVTKDVSDDQKVEEKNDNVHVDKNEDGAVTDSSVDTDHGGQVVNSEAVAGKSL